MNFQIALNQTGELRDAEGRIVGYFVPADQYEQLQAYREYFIAKGRQEYTEEQARKDVEAMLQAPPEELVTSEQFREFLDRLESELPTQGKDHAA